MILVVKEISFGSEKVKTISTLLVCIQHPNFTVTITPDNFAYERELSQTRKFLGKVPCL